MLSGFSEPASPTHFLDCACILCGLKGRLPFGGQGLRAGVGAKVVVTYSGQAIIPATPLAGVPGPVSPSKSGNIPHSAELVSELALGRPRTLCKVQEGLLAGSPTEKPPPLQTIQRQQGNKDLCWPRAFRTKMSQDDQWYPGHRRTFKCDVPKYVQGRALVWGTWVVPLVKHLIQLRSGPHAL